MIGHIGAAMPCPEDGGRRSGDMLPRSEQARIRAGVRFTALTAEEQEVRVDMVAEAEGWEAKDDADIS